MAARLQRRTIRMIINGRYRHINGADGAVTRLRITYQLINQSGETAATPRECLRHVSILALASAASLVGPPRAALRISKQSGDFSSGTHTHTAVTEPLASRVDLPSPLPADDPGTVLS